MLNRILRHRFGQAGKSDMRGDCGSGNGRGYRGGRGSESSNKPDSGVSGNCVCPQCGKTIPHKAGQPCRDLACPECGSMMVRE
jgi:hypothetical protein